ncbi:MAG: terminase family protein [Pseudomonadota bacterium]
MTSGAALIGYGPQRTQDDFIGDLTDEQVATLRYLFEFWALPHQCPPLGNWRTWVILGGRGAGKTRAGAEWIRSVVEGPTPLSAGLGRRIGMVGETLDQAREVMVFGESGLLNVCPPDRKPKWHASRRVLEWENGALAYVMSAHDPDALRGQQYDYVWADELAKWKKGQDAWDMLQFGLRLGDDPRSCVTTTPRNVPVLRDLLERDSCVSTHAATTANRANLAVGFLAEIDARYGRTRLGKQEIEGLLLDEAEGALWTTAQLAKLTVDIPPAVTRIVVAVDPSVSRGQGADACGIIVAGANLNGPVQEWRAVVLEDCTLQGASTTEWARAAVAALHRHGADRLIAEVNQGGDLVNTVIQSVAAGTPFSPMRATVDKIRRAEPIAALYEQGTVRTA